MYVSACLALEYIIVLLKLMVDPEKYDEECL